MGGRHQEKKRPQVRLNGCVHVNASCFSSVLVLVAESGFEQQNKRGPVAPHKRSTQALNSLPLWTLVSWQPARVPTFVTLEPVLGGIRSSFLERECSKAASKVTLIVFLRSRRVTRDKRVLRRLFYLALQKFPSHFTMFCFTSGQMQFLGYSYTFYPHRSVTSAYLHTTYVV